MTHPYTLLASYKDILALKPLQETSIPWVSKGVSSLHPEILGSQNSLPVVASSEPQISFPSDITSLLTRCWKRAIIVRIFEKYSEVSSIKWSLLNLWKIKGSLEIKELGYDFFAIHDLMEDDKTKILVGRPWKLGFLPILIRSWQPNYICLGFHLSPTARISLSESPCSNQ